MYNPNTGKQEVYWQREKPEYLAPKPRPATNIKHKIYNLIRDHMYRFGSRPEILIINPEDFDELVFMLGETDEYMDLWNLDKFEGLEIVKTCNYTPLRVK